MRMALAFAVIAKAPLTKGGLAISLDKPVPNLKKKNWQLLTSSLLNKLVMLN